MPKPGFSKRLATCRGSNTPICEPETSDDLGSQKWVKELRDEISQVFSRKSKKVGLRPTLDLSFIEDAPVIGENVYGEAFPDENRIWLQVVAPEASDKEISEIVCHELIHLKHLDWDHDSVKFKRATKLCMEC